MFIGRICEKKQSSDFANKSHASTINKRHIPYYDFFLYNSRMKKSVFIIILSLMLFSCKEKKDLHEKNSAVTQNTPESTEKMQENAIKEFVRSLSDDEKISQIFLVNIDGNKKFHAVEKTDGGKPLVPGGCLLFSYNIAGTPEETAAFISSIRDFYAENKSVPPYIAIDQEGGDVNRLRKMTSRLDSQKWVAEHFDTNHARQLYSAQAEQLRLLGINMNLAPVVEIENDSNSAFLGTRSFGGAEKTLAYAPEEICGYEEHSVATVLKHFPGNSSTDPHTGLPEIKTTKTELEEKYILPFRKLLAQSSAVLMSHAIIKVTDDDAPSAEKSAPACLSRFWVTEKVRSELGFNGLILSDDIFMGALSKNGFPPEKAAVQALEAGIDIIMLSEKKFGRVAKFLLEKASSDEQFGKIIDKAAENVIKYKIKAGLLILDKEKNDSENLQIFVREGEKSVFTKDEFTSAYKKGTELYE